MVKKKKGKLKTETVILHLRARGMGETGRKEDCVYLLHFLFWVEGQNINSTEYFGKYRFNDTSRIHMQKRHT